MSTTILLLSENDLKEMTTVNKNVDAAYIKPSALYAQDIGLQSIIGTQLYKKLLTLVDTGDITASENAAYKTLLDEYVFDYLKEQTIVELNWALLAKIRNNGIVTSQDQQTMQMDMSNCELLRKRHENHATFYSTRMTDYLRANANDYPEWCKRETVADMPSNKEGYKTNITL